MASPDPGNIIRCERSTASMSSIRHQANLISENCYDDLCFGVFPLSVEIMLSAAGGTCVS